MDRKVLKEFLEPPEGMALKDLLDHRDHRDHRDLPAVTGFHQVEAVVGKVRREFKVRKEFKALLENPPMK